MRKPIIDRGIWPEIQKKRKEGVSIAELSLYYKVSGKTIQRVVKRVKPDSIIWRRLNLNIDEVYQIYIREGSIEETARIYRTSSTSIKKLFKKYKYSWNSYKSNREYWFDTGYFKVINTEQKAYWLGFLYADGAMHKSGCGINIRLQEKDKSHLELLAKHINYKGKIRHEKSTNSYELSLYSQEMHRDLTQQGCTIRKSLTIDYPDYLDKKLQQHFIRGYFDGDGCITQSKKQTFSIVSNLIFITKLQEILIQELGISKTKLYKHRSENCYSMIYGGKNTIIKIAKFLYKEATTYLKRKKERFIWQ